jgi:hypothetical protein
VLPPGMNEEEELSHVLASATLLAEQGVISARELEEQKRQVLQSKVSHWMELQIGEIKQLK